MSQQQKPPRPELVPPRLKTAPSPEPQFSIPIPKPAFGAIATEPPSKLSMQAFDVAVALAIERLQSVPQKAALVAAPQVVPETRPATPRRVP